jgi:molybdenum cofactor sulfurtransferase
VAFNLQSSHGDWVSTTEVEKVATVKRIHIRTGGLCNPGGIATSLDLEPWEMKDNFSSGQRCGNENDIMNGKFPVLRASVLR